jgi:hypothetical protein
VALEKHSGMVTPLPAEMFSVTAERRWSCVSAGVCYVFPWISCQRTVRSLQALNHSAGGYRILLPARADRTLLPVRRHRIPIPRPAEWVGPRNYRRSSAQEPAEPVEARKQILRLLQRLMEVIS